MFVSRVLDGQVVLAGLEDVVLGLVVVAAQYSLGQVELGDGFHLGPKMQSVQDFVKIHINRQESGASAKVIERRADTLREDHKKD